MIYLYIYLIGAALTFIGILIWDFIEFGEIDMSSFLMASAFSIAWFIFPITYILNLYISWKLGIK